MIGGDNPTEDSIAEDVRSIRLSPLTCQTLAAQFGVSHVAIWKARNGLTYKWVDGTRGRPGRHGKLMDKQVRFIRNSTLPEPILSKRFGLSISQIGNIRRREHYRDVPDEEPRRASQGTDTPTTPNMEASNG